MSACEHVETWFDRTICPEPCGGMHTRCTACGTALDACPLEERPTAAAPGGDCQCGRGPVIGTCSWTNSRLTFIAFHGSLPVIHEQLAAQWRCLDCVADAVQAVANDEIPKSWHTKTGAAS